MKGICRFVAIFAIILCIPVRIAATEYTEYTAPQAPDFAEKYIPEDTESFGEGLLNVLKFALEEVQPNITEAIRICAKLIAVALLVSLIKHFEGCSVADLAGVICIATLMIEPVGVFIDLGTETMKQLHNYSVLLVPVMTGALSAQGAVTLSAGLYAGTTVFNSVLSNLIVNFLVPCVYILVVLCIADNAIHDGTLSNIKKHLKSFISWFLKIILYVFTGYMTITGVISGSADAYAVKAVKLTISGAVPVVGGIISDASEAILISAGAMKTTAGIYGIFAFIGICVGPFLKIAIHYLLLKLAATVSGIFGTKSVSALIHDYASVMGLILAMTGTICLFLLISTFCFMRGVA